jgi:hypothetical protein
MTDFPRKRGRPSKADVAAREAAAAQKPATNPEDDFLNEVLARPIGARKTILQVTDDTLRIISELAKLAATQKEIAAVLGVNPRTFQNFLYENEAAAQAWEDGLEHAKISLRRKQFGLADKNAPMAIFLGKNMLGQKDEQHNNLTVNKPAQEMSEEELFAIAQQAPRPKTPTSESVH